MPRLVVQMPPEAPRPERGNGLFGSLCLIAGLLILAWGAAGLLL